MKDIILRVVLVVVLLVLYVAMNNGVSDLLTQQEGMRVALTQGRSMWLGLSRWMSHVNWMLLLQKRASMSGKPDPVVAEALYNRYDVTTDQDPFLMLAYEHGGIELATIGRPKRGLELLDKGMKVMGDENWKLPSYAARIVSYYMKDDPNAEKRTREYLEKAKKANNHPFYIESALVRIQGRGFQDDPVKMANLWKEVGARTAEGYTGQPGVIGPGPGVAETGNQYGKQARDKVVTILRKVRAQTAKEKDPAKKAKLDEQAQQIVEIVKTMMGSEHACNFCFAEYDAGDSHCPNCGRIVEVYGVCVKPGCGRILPTSAKFCPACGTKAPKPKIRQANATPPIKPETK